MLPEITQACDLRLPSNRILDEINKTNFSHCKNVLPAFLGGNSVAETFQLEMTVHILKECDLRSVNALSCSCSSLNTMMKKISLLIKYEWAKDHEKRYAKIYEIDPGNAVHFGQSIDMGEGIFSCLADEACVYRANKYARIKVDTSETLLQKGDRILPLLYKHRGGWFHMFRPVLVETAYEDENEEKALKYIQKRDWKMIQAYPNFLALNLSNDPRGIAEIVQEIKNCGIFHRKPWGNYCKILLCVATAPESMPPFNKWKNF